MLIALLYHRVGTGKYANSLSFFQKHFSWIHERYETVVPGECFAKKGGVCLTFDDATFDFYYYLFPLIKRWGLKAVLSVPVGLIPEKVSLCSSQRLQKVLTPPLCSAAYCTWDELREMQDSKLIHFASHSVNHVALTLKEVDVKYELLTSKMILEKQINGDISTFVYPYGKFNEQVHALAKKYYRYIMRIGNAANFSWQNRNHLIYRINADALMNHYAPFRITQKVKYLTRYYVNTFRHR